MLLKIQVLHSRIRPIEVREPGTYFIGRSFSSPQKVELRRKGSGKTYVEPAGALTKPESGSREANCRAVSRSHLLIKLQQDPPRVVIRDLDSANGTYVQGERISFPYELPEGANHLEIGKEGRIKILFEWYPSN